MTASITSRTFGFLPTGQCVTAWLLTGQGGLQLEVLAYGGTVSCLLVPLQAHGLVDYLEHFKQLWTAAMTGFLRSAGPGDILVFAPELLPGTHYYARQFPNARGGMEEESDRYAQALLYKDIAYSCFAEASAGSNSPTSRRLTRLSAPG